MILTSGETHKTLTVYYIPFCYAAKRLHIMFLLRLSKGEEDTVCSWCFPVSHGSLFLSEQSLLLALPCLCDTLVSSEFSPGWARRMWWLRFLCLWSHGSSLLTGRLACEYMPPFENNCQRSQQYKTVLNRETCSSISCPGVWFTRSWHSSVSTRSLLKGFWLWQSACTHKAWTLVLDSSSPGTRRGSSGACGVVQKCFPWNTRAWTVIRHHYR